jgi:outer membrane protein OmpA-like peptidoglycan-associated protein
MTGRARLLAAAVAAVTVGCGTSTEPTPPPAAAPTENPSDDQRDDAPDEEPEERTDPRSTASAGRVTGDRSSAEVRVGELIAEYDGTAVDTDTVMTLPEPVLFAFDSAELKAAASGPLDDLAEIAAFHDQAPIRVVGHTDAVGSADYNRDLSLRRAEAVVAALVERGVDPARLDAEGRGFDDPVAGNDTDAGRAANRRVEVVLVGIETPS